MTSFSLGKIEVTWSQDNALDHTSAQALTVIQNAGFELLRHTANGSLEDQEQQFFYNWIGALENCWTKCISVAGDYVKKWQNMMCICRS